MSVSLISWAVVRERSVRGKKNEIQVSKRSEIPREKRLSPNSLKEETRDRSSAVDARYSGSGTFASSDGTTTGRRDKGAYGMKSSRVAAFESRPLFK